jgi:DNA-binding response OmpR family regulator
LIVDDDPAIRDSLGSVLEEHGFDVLTAPDGYQGLKTFRERSPAAAVVDIIMPEQDGIGTMLQMRRERRDLKVVVISGGSDFDGSDYLPIAEQLGADASFRKTLDPIKLVMTLRRLLGSEAE